jgi:hypothetical protein
MAEEKRLRGSVSIQEVRNTGNYNSTRLSASWEFYQDEKTLDDAYDMLREWIDKKLPESGIEVTTTKRAFDAAVGDAVGKMVPTITTTMEAADIEAVLDSMPWKPFKTGGGDWVFVHGPDGRTLNPILTKIEWLIDELDRTGYSKAFGGYNYTVTEHKKFINRRPVK